MGGVTAFNSTIREGFDIIVEGTRKERDREINALAGKEEDSKAVFETR